jgi:hypothetical protein
MSLRERSQRRQFDRAFHRLQTHGSEEQRRRLQGFTREMLDDLYQLSLDEFVQKGGGKVIAYDESQTPILDALIDFFKYLVESGALWKLIELFFGIAMSEEDEVTAFYTALANGS